MESAYVQFTMLEISIVIKNLNIWVRIVRKKNTQTTNSTNTANGKIT